MTSGRSTTKGFGFIAPAVVFVAVWIYGPLIFTAILSVFRWNLTTGNPRFVGLTNYRTLFNGGEFGHAGIRTILYVLGLFPFATAVPFALAVLVWKHDGPAKRVYRTLFFAPVVFAPVASAIAWQFLLDPLLGAVNQLLGLAHLPQPNWLGSPNTALWAIVFITGTKVAALNFLLYSAGLASIDKRSVEAARMDGASEGEISRRLLVPLLSRTVALTSVLAIVFGGQWVFTNVSVLTQGGPAGATDNVFYWLYVYGFQFFDAGLASAGAVVVTVALGIVLVAFRVLPKLRFTR